MPRVKMIELIRGASALERDGKLVKVGEVVEVSNMRAARWLRDGLCEMADKSRVAPPVEVPQVAEVPKPATSRRK